MPGTVREPLYIGTVGALFRAIAAAIRAALEAVRQLFWRSTFRQLETGPQDNANSGTKTSPSEELEVSTSAGRFPGPQPNQQADGRETARAKTIIAEPELASGGGSDEAAPKDKPEKIEMSAGDQSGLQLQQPSQEPFEQVVSPAKEKREEDASVCESSQPEEPRAEVIETCKRVNAEPTGMLADDGDARRPCPRCGITCPPEEEAEVFGYRKMQWTNVTGENVSAIHRQSYCRRCRAEHASEIRKKREIGAPHGGTPAESSPTLGGSGLRPPSSVQASPRQYRPPSGAPPPSLQMPTRGGAMEPVTKRARDRALDIEVRVLFEHGGFCAVTLLPKRTAELPEELLVSSSSGPLELTVLQDEWYQDVRPDDLGRLLRDGTEWSNSGGGQRWVLSGREMYVFCPHGDLNGFVGTPRLILGEQHLVLCTTERLQDVLRAIEVTGSPSPTMLNAASGIPTGWVGLRGIVPRKPVAPSERHDILNALRPLGDVEIVLEGGIRLERLTWLSGYPPRIRLRGDVGAIDNVVIDGREATLSPDGGYATPGWDLPGQHQVWSASASRSYSICEGAEGWEAWAAYTWSMGDFSADGERSRPAICGVLVQPPCVMPRESCTVMMPVSNPILIGAVPGEIQTCEVRSDVRAEACTGFPWFDPVWALPADAIRCDKRIARVLLIGNPRPIGKQDPPQRAGAPARPQRASRDQAKRIDAWCSAILTAGRKGLRTEPTSADIAALWQAYKRRAKAIWRGLG